ncbi:MAG: hypothetical protein V1743_02025, partial [Nanoarchaeota archaeon]
MCRGIMDVSLENIVKRGARTLRNGALGILAVGILSTSCEKDTTRPDPLSSQPLWQELSPQDILEDSPDGTIIYQNLKSKVSFDGDILFKAEIAAKFTPYFQGNDLKIKDIEPNYTGTGQVKVYANSKEATFMLTITPVDDPVTWGQIPDISIRNAPPNNLEVIHDVTQYASDPDSPLEFSVISPPVYNLTLAGNALIIRDVSPDYQGREDVEITCNNITTTFGLTVKPPIYERIHEAVGLPGVVHQMKMISQGLFVLIG